MNILTGLFQIFTFLSIFHNYKTDCAYNIFRNNFLTERRYYNTDKQMVGIVYYSTVKSKTVQIDSFRLYYDSSKQISEVRRFDIRGKMPKEIIPAILNSNISNISIYKTECEALYSLKESFLIGNELGDICNIKNSILVNGIEIGDLELIRNNRDDTYFEYSNINSRFSSLSLDLEMYFNNSILKKFQIDVRNRYLVNEKYYFEEGTLQRDYFYEEGSHKNIDIYIDYRNGKNYFVRERFAKVR